MRGKRPEQKRVREITSPMRSPALLIGELLPLLRRG